MEYDPSTHAVWCKFKADEALKSFYEYQREGLQYDLELIKAQIDFWLPDLEYEISITPVYDSEGLQVSIKPMIPKGRWFNIENEVYEAILDIEDELVFNSWSVYSIWKEQNEH
tara:strand:+ start:441 stop:779 length:339 start_codon:yes stop_codon:yes gene_type:complete